MIMKYEPVRSTPENEGVTSKALGRLIEALQEWDIPLHSLLAARHGKIILEAYYEPYDENTLHRMFSITKSFTSLAIGILEQDGRLRLTDKICSYFPEYLPGNPHPWLLAVTIEDMLTMRTCHNHTTYNKTSDSENWVRSFFETEPARRPGTVFMYDTSASHTLCALVEKLTGKELLEFLKERVLNQIGFSQDSYIIKDPFGTSMGGSGLMAYPMDLMKLGLLLMNHGRSQADNRQLYPRSYLERAVACHCIPGRSRSERDGYGYQFWLLPDGGYACCGMGDQLLLCYPKQDMIFVITADTQGMAGGTDIIYKLVESEIFPYLTDGKAEQKPEDSRQLKEKIRHLTVPLVTAGTKKGVPAVINGRMFPLCPNTGGFEHMGMKVEEGALGSLIYVRNGKKLDLPFGMGRLAESVFPEYGQKCVSSGAWIDGETFEILCWLVDETVASVSFKLHFGLSGLTVQMKKTEETRWNEYQGILNTDRGMADETDC